MAPPRLLLVADPSERATFRSAFEAAAMDVVLVDCTDGTDGTDAFEQLTRDKFDCAIVGDAFGPAWVSGARARELALPIVLVSANPDEEHLQAAIDAGVTDYVWKTDLAPRRLVMRVQFAMRVHRAELESRRVARARDEVLAIVSHDVRGPLHSIGLACEALRDIGRSTGSEESLRYVATIERASQRAERLVADLLEANAIENGSLALDVRNIDAAAVVRQAASDHEADSKGAISTTIPPGATLVTADRDRVLQVLSNLIGNALKHAKGSPIELSLATTEHDAVIAVRDRGPGITDHELAHIFDRYWRGRTKRSGAGLGLAIAKGIVDAHGGTITVTSKHELGSEFAFTLPLAR